MESCLKTQNPKLFGEEKQIRGLCLTPPPPPPSVPGRPLCFPHVENTRPPTYPALQVRVYIQGSGAGFWGMWALSDGRSAGTLGTGILYYCPTRNSGDVCGLILCGLGSTWRFMGLNNHLELGL